MNIEQIIAEIANLKTQETHIKECLTELSGILTDAYQAGQIEKKTVTEHGTATISVTRRLNTTQLSKQFPVTERPELYQPKLDTKRVRENLSPKDLDAFMDETMSVRVQ